MAKLSSTPAFAHDCAKCRFRAQVRPLDGAVFDLYDGCDGSVIARTSSEGADYHAMDSSFAGAFVDKLDSTLGRAFFVRALLDRLALV